jgi:addiction module RelE/StbE family toxin
MARQIIWSLRAQQDRKAIFSYWNNRNRSNLYSKKLNRLFKEAIAFLSEHPQIGRKTKLENVSVKIVRDYLILYEISDSTIIVHTIWDGHRNPDELFTS